MDAGDPMAAILANLEEGLKHTDEQDASPIAVEIVNMASPDVKRQERGLREIINYSLEERNRDYINRRDGIAPIVKLLKSGESALLRNLAAHALANMAIHTPSHRSIVTEGGIDALAAALGSTDGGVRERALAALCNLCLTDDNIRISVVQANATGRIIEALGSADDATVRAALMLVANLSVNPAVAGTIGDQGGVAATARHLSSADPEKSKFALFAFASLSGNPRNHPQLEGQLRELARFFSQQDPTIEVKVLTVLVNVSGNVSGQGLIVQHGLAGEVVRKLDRDDPTVRTLAIQTIQNLAMSDQGCRAVDTFGARKVLQILKLGNPQLALPCIHAITNLTTNATIRKALADDGGLAAVQRYEGSADPTLRDAASKAAGNLKI